MSIMLKIVIGILIVSLGVIIFGGFKYALSQGNPRDMELGKTLIIYGFMIGMIGLIISILDEGSKPERAEVEKANIVVVDTLLIKENGRMSVGYYCELTSDENDKEYIKRFNTKEEAKKYCETFEMNEEYEIRFKNYYNKNYIE